MTMFTLDLMWFVNKNGVIATLEGMFMKLGKSLMVLTLLWGAQVRADYSAKIYEPGSKRGRELFVLSVTSSAVGADEKVIATYSDAQTKEVAQIETAILRGEKFVRLELDQKQLNAKATVEVRDGRAYFTRTTDGTTKSDDEAIKGDFVISSNFQRYVKSKWAEIMADKTVEFRFGVWDRMETVGFSIRKISAQGEGDQKTVTVKMKASNFIIAALVNPLEFKFSANGDRIVEMNGRVAPRIKKDGKYVDLDAEMVYFYP